MKLFADENFISLNRISVFKTSSFLWEKKTERTALNSLASRPDIIIRPADKGSAVVIQDAAAYRSEVMRQLSNEKFYRKLDKDPTQKNNNVVRQAVRSLQDRGVINDKTARDLVETKVRTPHFYTLPKIHKDAANPPGRPIVSSTRAPTERISAFVDIQLKPIVQSLPSFVRDTKDFISGLQELPPLPPDALLFTLDVVGLYNNIPHKDGLEACRIFLDRRQQQHPPTSDIINLAELVLNLNSFAFEDSHYLQVHGTAMGTRMAPSYANLFMGNLEKKILDSAPEGKLPLAYRRFIDDIFGIWLYGEAALLRFIAHANECHPDIQFTFSYGRSVPYLDASVSIKGEHLVTDLYTKPTDTHQYLLPSSDHPPHVHQNLPYGLAMRLHTIISEPETLESRLKELASFLSSRGYPAALMDRQFAAVKAIPRQKLLAKPKKTQWNNRVPLVCTWSQRLPGPHALIDKLFPTLQATDRLLNVFQKPFVSFRRSKNLKDLLVRTTPRYLGPPNQPGTHPCKAPRCKTCPLVKTSDSLPLPCPPGHYTCTSTNVIYAITCTACTAVYIGETGCTLRERMTGHRYTVAHNEDTPVADHFTQVDGTHHKMRVAVLAQAPDDTRLRRILERRWIEKMKNKPALTVINRDDGVDILTLWDLYFLLIPPLIDTPFSHTHAIHLTHV